MRPLISISLPYEKKIQDFDATWLYTAMAAQGPLRETRAPTTSQLEMHRRRSERGLTPAEHVQSLYQASLDRFYADFGSHYPCSQSELDFHHQGRFLRENRGPFVSLSRSTEEVMVQNDERRRPSFDERRAILNLEYVIHDHNFVYHPDIIVKVFNDLDTLFFSGRLSGNVLVSWANSTQCAELEQRTQLKPGRLLGFTDGFVPGEQGQARIYLNPSGIFLGRPANEDPLRKMFSTLIHEVSCILILIEVFPPLHADFTC